jgi:hypothetical protein
MAGWEDGRPRRPERLRSEKCKRLGAGEIRNPKFESNSEAAKARSLKEGCISSSLFISAFGLRVSDFSSPPLPSPLTSPRALYSLMAR